MNALSGDNAGSDHFNTPEFFGFDGSLTVDRLSNGRNNAAQNRFAHRNLSNSAGSFNRIAFLDVGILAHDGDTDIILFKVERKAENAAWKFHKLHGHDFLQAVYAGDSISNRQDDAGFTQLDLLVIILDLLFNYLAYFFSF